jgi:hypothetical protein
MTRLPILPTVPRSKSIFSRLKSLASNTLTQRGLIEKSGKSSEFQKRPSGSGLSNSKKPTACKMQSRASVDSYPNHTAFTKRFSTATTVIPLCVCLLLAMSCAAQACLSTRAKTHSATETRAHVKLSLQCHDGATLTMPSSFCFAKQQSQKTTSQRIPTLEWWLAQNHHRTHSGNALDFASHRYLVGIYQDKSHDVIIRSSAQSGKSEYLNCYTLGCVSRGHRVFWVFPTEGLRDQHVRDKLDPCIDATPFYSRMVQSAKKGSRSNMAPDGVSLKQLGKASMALVASNSKTAFKAYTADVAVIDEVDFCDQDNLAMAPDRLQHSTVGHLRRVSNPTIPGYGIDALYRDSDQRVWHVKCDHCNEWQTVDWFANVVREVSEGRYELRRFDPEITAVCSHCDAALDRLSRGEWVPMYPGRPVSGYFISQLFAGNRPLSDMYLRFERGQTNAGQMQAFYNGSLGLPYSAPGSSLTLDILQARVSDHPRLSSFDGDCYGGCDVGSLNHLTIEDAQGRVILIEAVTWGRLDECMSLFPNMTLVIDALPELNRCMEWAARYPGRVFRSYVNKKVQRDEPFDVDYASQETSGERTQMIDRAFARYFKSESLYLPRDAMSIEGFADHMTAPSRVLDIKRTPPQYIWTEGSQADHYAMSDVYRSWAREIACMGGGRVFFG